MKKYVALISLLISSSVAFASSDVIFPIHDQVIKPYPDVVSLPLNGTNGSPLLNDVAYSLTCHINNPNSDEVVVLVLPNTSYKMTLTGFTAMTINDYYTGGDMVHLKPGVNTLKVSAVATGAESPNTVLNFKNFDKTESVVIQDCKAVIR